MKPVIVHISSDYPDPVIPEKTRAVRELVEGTQDRFRHIVYSLNRVNGWSGLTAQPFGEENTVIMYKALPKGLFWEKRLPEIADWIMADLEERSIIPDLVEAHKFTVEGVIGLKIARKYNKPLAVDIQGDSDTRILKNKPGLRSVYREISAYAEVVFPFAPWPVPMFQEKTGLDAAKCVLLPVVPGIDTLSLAPVSAQNNLITVFNIDSWKRKNIIGVMAAIKQLSGEFPHLTLDIYGRGKKSSLKAMLKAMAESGLGERIDFKGPARNAGLPALMKNYAAFVQPALRETYGLVHAEALFAGLPVVFSKGRGIDGYLPAHRIGYAADPHDTGDIAAGIRHVLLNQADLKKSVTDMQQNGSLDILRKSRILSDYTSALTRVLALQTSL